MLNLTPRGHGCRFRDVYLFEHRPAPSSILATRDDEPSDVKLSSHAIQHMQETLERRFTCDENPRRSTSRGTSVVTAYTESPIVSDPAAVQGPCTARAAIFCHRGASEDRDVGDGERHLYKRTATRHCTIKGVPFCTGLYSTGGMPFDFLARCGAGGRGAA